jgi:flagellar biogenesis protein FliO
MDLLSGNLLQGVVALVFVIVLIAVALFVLKRFGVGTATPIVKGKRQPRLGLVDSTAIDQRRKLVIVRRDNVEHLLMIGGATDVVIETNIVRTAPAQALRDAAPRLVEEDAAPEIRPPAAIELGPVEPRPAPPKLPEPANAPSVHDAWPLQPAADIVPAAPIVPVAEIVPSAELTPPADKAASELRLTPAAPPKLSKAEDQNLAEMAQRLEAALRRPAAPEPKAPAPTAIPAPVPAPMPAAAPALGGVTRDEEPAGTGKDVYQSLEQEMASLLGRPHTKT